MSYFTHFPKIAYDLRGVEDQPQFDQVTNILARVVIRSAGYADINNSSLEELVGTAHFQKHIITDSDRPDILAHQYYRDSNLHWLILYANGNRLLNPYYDWPMTQYDLVKFTKKKYGADNIYGTHHYESGGYQVDSTASGATVITNLLHEETINDNKRPIAIMQPAFIGPVIDEFKKLMSTQ